MNPTLKAAYHTVQFRSEGLKESIPSLFVIVTAFNPKGRNAPLSRNQHADQTLRGYLTSQDLSPIRVIGMSLDQKHQEPGWAIEVNEEHGVKIGKRFQQEAIFVVHEEEVYLVSCFDQTQKAHIGSWIQLQVKGDEIST